MTLVRPSARVRLTLRTEEFADTEALEARLPPPQGIGAFGAPKGQPAPVDARVTDLARGQQLLKENQDALLALFAEFDSMPQEEFDRQREQLRQDRERVQADSNQAAVAEVEIGDVEIVPVTDGGPEIGPIVFTGGGQPPEAVVGNPPDDLTVVGTIEPISVSIERNGLSSADTCTVVLDAADAPLDPRVLRAAHVDVVLGVVSADDFQAGMEYGQRREDGSLMSIVGAPLDGSFRGATRFVGYVDTISISFSDQGDTVTLECRDMSAVLRDKANPPGLSIDLSLPLDQGVEQYLTAVSASSAGVRVRFVSDLPAPIPIEAMGQQPTGNTRRRGRRGARAQRGRRGGEQMTAWDHITDVCRGLGFIPMVDGFEVVITEARTLYGSTNARRMVYGRNLTDLSFTRTLQGAKVPTIEVRCYDPVLGRTRWARYPVRAGEMTSGVFGVDNPPAALRANEVPPSGSNPEESIRVMQVSGVSDPAILSRVARNAFEQIGRQEIEGSFNTDDVHSYDRPADFADLLDARAGEPVELLVMAAVPPELADRGETNTTLAQLQAMTRARRRDYLMSIGWPERLATRFAALQEANEFQTVFRIQDVRLAWDRDSGCKVQVGFVNYVVVREEPAAENVIELDEISIVGEFNVEIGEVEIL